MEAPNTKDVNTQDNIPPPNYTQQQPVHAVAVGAVPIVLTDQQIMGLKPSTITCRSCNTTVTTKTTRKSQTKTHLFAALLCLLGCWCCVCVPYCMDSCNNIEHYCPNCNSYIGASR